MIKQILALIGLTLSLSANAVTLTADPDTVWGGPATALPVDDAFAGVTLSTNVDNGSVLALGAGVTEVPGWEPASFGHGAINFPDGACSGCWSFGFAELMAEFSQPTQFVSFDFIDRFSGTAIVKAYNSFGDFLGTSTMELVGHEAVDATRISVEFYDASGSISYAIAGADTGEYGVIDKLTWSTSEVPIPATAYLIGCGLLGLGVVKRKNTQRKEAS